MAALIASRWNIKDMSSPKKMRKLSLSASSRRMQPSCAEALESYYKYLMSIRMCPSRSDRTLRTRTTIKSAPRRDQGMQSIVVLGAGMAAAPFIRQVMASIVLKRDDIKMIVVSPSDRLPPPIAMPRAIMPGQLALEKVLYRLEPPFMQYPVDKFEFVPGAATAMDSELNQVTVVLANSSKSRVISYDTLVIATGASATVSMPWKMSNTAEHTIERLQSLQRDIERARTIVVVGGGLTGLEVAGELGFEYARTGAKEVYLIVNDDLPLETPVIGSVSRQARTDLEKLKVKIINNTSVVDSCSSGDDIVLQLRHANGKTKTITAQAYIPTTGLLPNTSFVPSNMLDKRGFVRQSERLQAQGHRNVFVIGDAGDLEPSKAIVADSQSKYLIDNFATYLDGGEVPQYKPATTPILGVDLGRRRASGQFGNFNFLSLLICCSKERLIGTDIIRVSSRS